MPSPILLLLFFPLTVAMDSLLCIDSVHGSCEAPPDGWCFHDKTTGKFDCDSRRICPQLNETTSRGIPDSGRCVKYKSTHDCCCRDKHGCNIAFPTQPPWAMQHLQSCTLFDAMADEDSHHHPRNCSDPWCYFYLETVEGRPPSIVQFGCHSQAILKYHMYKKQDQLWGNTTKWKHYAHLMDEPTCGDIAYNGTNVNGTVSQCFKKTWKARDEIHTRIICCCRGSKHCNDNFTRQSASIDEAEVVAQRERRLAGEESARAGTSLSLPSLPLLSLLILFYLSV